MSAHCLVVALGPVQDFIAQSRRMRDLWFGSHLLSEVSRAAARAVAEEGGHLVFPALQRGDPELEPCMTQLRPKGSAPLNVANKVVANLPEGVDPHAVAVAARDAAARVVHEEGDRVLNECAGLLAPNVRGVWDEQLNSLLEFYSAWAPIGTEGYAAALLQAETAVAARKNLRDFRQWTKQRGSVPKSSFDGLRETVLAPPEQRSSGLARRFRIGDGEQLDAVGMVKRCGGKPDQFVPLANVAFVPWLGAASRDCAGELSALVSACGEANIGGVHRPDIAWTTAFPFDAQVVLEDRWAQVLDECGSSAVPTDWGEAYVSPLLRRLHAPSPYVACLVADGDNMGTTISGLKDEDSHRRFSLALAQFAASARGVVEGQFKGLLVYSGGDDVLAFVSVDQAVACAESLAKTFAAGLAASGIDGGLPLPTLSVGLGIGHVLTPLGELLALGRRAERLAKNGADPADVPRNALGVIVSKRSGGDTYWRRPWGGGVAASAELNSAMALLAGPLSERKVYEVRAVTRRLGGDVPPARSQEAARALAGDVRRTLLRNDTGVALDLGSIGLDLSGDNRGPAAIQRDVENWVGLMLVARMAASTRR